MIVTRVMSVLRRALVGVVHRGTLHHWPSGVAIGRNVRIFSHPGGRILLGRNVTLMDDVILEVGPEGEIVIGDDSWLHVGVIVSARSRVTIGHATLIGEYSSVRDADHGIVRGNLIMRQPFNSAPVQIGDDVWIGRGVAILKGVTIGNGSVVGANAVVTSSLPDGKISVGVPARVVGERR